MRAVAGGRPAVRSVLSMAAMVAKRCNPTIAAFAKRLSGKKPKVVLVACMRKLIIILNAIVRRQTMWIEHQPTRLAARGAKSGSPSAVVSVT